MIFDSSIWIDFLRGKDSKAVDVLQTHIRESERVSICPPVYQEVLQGIRDERIFKETKNLLLSLDFLNVDPYFASEGAIDIYRKLRAKGITIEKPNDCVIAFYAIHFKLDLVHNDKDFDKIAKHTALKVYKT